MTKPTRKARSRLKQPKKRQPLKNVGKTLQPFTSRLKYLPLLLIAAICYTGLYWLMNAFHPESIRNILLQNSFLPFHLILLAGNFFLFTFLTLSRRFGLLLSLAIQWLFFLKLQNFTLDVWAWGSAILMSGIVYFLNLILLKKR